MLSERGSDVLVCEESKHGDVMRFWVPADVRVDDAMTAQRT